LAATKSLPVGSVRHLFRIHSTGKDPVASAGSLAKPKIYEFPDFYFISLKPPPSTPPIVQIAFASLRCLEASAKGSVLFLLSPLRFKAISSQF
jgi:hypothetical protein